jgi:hypothetical protein
MALRTAPCPQCKTVIVFGERACRSCGLVFNYGASAPPEPTEAEVFDALLSAQPAATSPKPAPELAPAPAPAPAPVPPAARPAPVSTQTAPREPAVATMPGLDTGRFSVGDVDVDDVPGLIDSTLFASFTPAHVDVAPIPGLEVNRVDTADVRVVPLDVDHGRVDDVGEVATQAIPGIYGSDMFADHVDIAAGGEASPSLEVSHIRVRAKPSEARAVVDEQNLRTIACMSCGTMHSRTRCPACATPHTDLS